MATSSQSSTAGSGQEHQMLLAMLAAVPQNGLPSFREEEPDTIEELGDMVVVPDTVGLTTYNSVGEYVHQAFHTL